MWTKALEYAGNSKDFVTGESRESVGVKGFDVVFDANGISTLEDSWENLSQGGKLVIYGFHSMLPKKGGIISYLKWIKIGWDYLSTPTFDPMEMISTNRSVLSFNLSFLFRRTDFLKKAMD